MKNLLFAVLVLFAAPLAAQEPVQPDPQPAPAAEVVPAQSATELPLEAVAPVPPKHYFRLISGGNFWQSAAIDTPLHGGPSAGVTNIPIFTHATADGTILPQWLRDLGAEPEDWTPLQVGGGGSFSGTALVTIGASANAAPWLLGWTAKGITSSSPGWLQVYRAAILGGGSGRLRIGIDAVGAVARDGHFQSFKGMFPGQRIGEILGNAANANIGMAWKW